MVDIAVGIKDILTGSEHSLNSQYSELMRYRAKMKERTWFLDLGGVFSDPSILVAADFGAGKGIEEAPFTEEDTWCGTYVTLYFNIDRLLPRLYAFGELLSHFEIVYDPIPFSGDYNEWDPSLNLKIDSPDFQVPNGLFGSCDIAPTFSGSTFKVGPKIYSDEAMKQFQYFPLINGWEPFKDCPNLERIENQGVFGDALEGLLECHLSFKKSDGFDSLAAYPSGGAPRFIKNYINAETIHFSERFPEISAERLKTAENPFNIENIVVNTFGSPQFPFGGIDYSEAEMDTLYFDFNFDFILPEDFNKNFVFGLGIFGITAPKSCKDVKGGFYKLFEFSEYDEQEKISIVTQDFLKENFSFFWGKDLEEFLLEHSEKFTVDLVPKVCDGLKRIDAYYSRDVIGALKSINYRSPYRHKIFLNDNPHTIEVQRLPETTEIVMRYAMELYANLIIEDDIFVPALPSGVRYIRDAYKRLFYNSIGPQRAITSPMEKETVILLGFNRSRDNSRDTDNVVYIIPNATAEDSGGFEAHYNSANNGRSLRSHGSSYTFKAETAPETYAELINLVKNSNSNLFSNVIESDIILEKNSFNALEFCGGFQDQCFFGAAIDPRNVDALIPLNALKSWKSYEQSLLISIGFGGAAPIFWTGETRHSENDDNFTRRFFIASSQSFSDEDLQALKINIDDVVMSGAPLIEDEDTTISPYRGTFSSFFEGDFTAFQSENGIVLDDPNSMVARLEDWDYRDLSVSGGKIGFNTKFITDPDNIGTFDFAYHDFVVSYFPDGYAKTGIVFDESDGVFKRFLKIIWSNLKEGLGYESGYDDSSYVNGPEEFYFNWPFVANFEDLRKIPPGMMYYGYSSGTGLWDIAEAIKNYTPDPD